MEYTVRKLRKIGKTRLDRAKGYPVFRVRIALDEPLKIARHLPGANLDCNSCTNTFFMRYALVRFFDETPKNGELEVTLVFELSLHSERLPVNEHSPKPLKEDIERLIREWPNGVSLI